MGENLGFLGILEFLSLCHCEGAKRPKQSLGILEFLGFLGVRGYFLGILDLGILEFLGNSKLALSFKLRGSGSKN